MPRGSPLRLMILVPATPIWSISSEIPVDVIKIDKVFVSRIGQRTTAEQLLLSVIEMAKVLNMRIVAEGVETEVQADWLRRTRCWLVTGGFLFKACAARRAEAADIRRR